MATTNVEGLERTLQALRNANGLLEVDEALVALAQGLAAAVDADPANAALWREYRAALTTLRDAGSAAVDEDTASFFVSIRTPAVRPALGHGPDR
jgi:hypothetical protein